MLCIRFSGIVASLRGIPHRTSTDLRCLALRHLRSLYTPVPRALLRVVLPVASTFLPHDSAAARLPSPGCWPLTALCDVGDACQQSAMSVPVDMHSPILLPSADDSRCHSAEPRRLSNPPLCAGFYAISPSWLAPLRSPVEIAPAVTGVRGAVRLSQGNASAHTGAKPKRSIRHVYYRCNAHPSRTPWSRPSAPHYENRRIVSFAT